MVKRRMRTIKATQTIEQKPHTNTLILCLNKIESGLSLKCDRASDQIFGDKLISSERCKKILCALKFTPSDKFECNWDLLSQLIAEVH